MEPHVKIEHEVPSVSLVTNKSNFDHALDRCCTYFNCFSSWKTFENLIQMQCFTETLISKCTLLRLNGKGPLLKRSASSTVTVAKLT